MFLYVKGSLWYFYIILVILLLLFDLKRKLMFNRVVGLGFDDFLYEFKKGGGGVDEVILFFLVKGKNKKIEFKYWKGLVRK